MSGMWNGNIGGMMDGTGQTAVQNTALPFFGVAFVVVVGVAVVGAVGLAYYVALPEIKTGAHQWSVNLFRRSRLNRSRRLLARLLNRS